MRDPTPISAAHPDGDMSLARRCATGDRAAQLALIARQRSQVHRTIFRIMGSNRHMEDLAQDTFIEVLRSIGSFRGESTLNTWVDCIAARTTFRYLSARDPQAQPIELLPELRAPDQDPEREAQSREALRRLYQVLDRLEPKYRIAYALGVIDGRPLGEVARITGVSIIAAKNRVWRARRMVNQRARRDPFLAEFLTEAEKP